MPKDVKSTIDSLMTGINSKQATGVGHTNLMCLSDCQQGQVANFWLVKHLRVKGPD